MACSGEFLPSTSQCVSYRFKRPHLRARFGETFVCRFSPGARETERNFKVTGENGGSLLKVWFSPHIIVSHVRIVSVVPCRGQAIASNSVDPYVVRFSHNRLCRNSARRDWVLRHATPCFDDKEVHCGLPLHRFCRKDRPQSFPIAPDARIEHGFIWTMESLLS